MITWFEADGYPSNHLNYYTYWSLSGVKSAAATLETKVDGVLTATGKKKVDLVCHSMGGLVARYYMKYLGGAKKVNQVVYIATPHKGTTWAYGAFDQSAIDMRPNSTLLKSIDGYWPGLGLWSSCDEIVLPNSSAAYGTTVVCIGCWGHIASTWSWDVYTKTRDYVKP
jgi:triacylglycerol lipase